MQDQSYTTGSSNVPAQMGRDEEMTQQAHETLAEAAERVTFHRCEVERWERIGRAAQASLNHLQSASPVAKMPPDGFLNDGGEPVAAKW